MEGVWKHLTDSWQDSRFKEYKDVFFAEAEKYFKDTKSNNRLRLSKAQYLALFASMAMAESAGGKNLYNETSQAYGWYQIVKGTDHLDKYNGEFGTNYEYKDLLNNDKVSIDVGIWALMRYRNTIDELRDACPPYKKDPDWHVLLKFFKAGSLFTKNSDDTLWWNRITYATKKLLNHNYLSMEYLDYFMPIKGTSMWDGPYKASEFEDNLAHIGNIKVT
jgi:hypothetical protein